MGTVRNFYNENAGTEWERLLRHRIEFEVTCMALNEYISGNSRILDIGGGPGRYSIYLAKKGNRVTLTDLASENLKLGIQEAKKCEVKFEDVIELNALNLSCLENECYDVVLLMGPLYHLLNLDDRKKAVTEALRVLKPGGIIFSAFISRYAPVIDLLKNYPKYISDYEKTLFSLIKNGENIESEENPGFTDAYFSTPDEAISLMENAGLKTLRFSAVEGFVGITENKLYELDEKEFKKWIELIYKVGNDPNCIGISEHLLYVGMK